MAKVSEYFTAHRTMLLIIAIFLVCLFAYYNFKYVKENRLLGS